MGQNAQIPRGFQWFFISSNGFDGGFDGVFDSRFDSGFEANRYLWNVKATYCLC